jgi:ribosome recycling factor
MKKIKNLIRNLRGKLYQQIQKMEKRISGAEDTIEEMDSLVKKMLN